MKNEKKKKKKNITHEGLLNGKKNIFVAEATFNLILKRGKPGNPLWTLLKS